MALSVCLIFKHLDGTLLISVQLPGGIKLGLCSSSFLNGGLTALLTLSCLDPAKGWEHFYITFTSIWN